MSFLSSCNEELVEKSPSAQAITPAPDSLPTPPQVYPTNEKRLKKIKEDYNRDNFDFNQFDSIDWRNDKTFGEPCAGFCVQPTKSAIPEHLVFKELGISSDNYYAVSISGDGSCWIRSVIQALLFRAFQEQKVFDAMLANIKRVKYQYKAVPGFSDRFREQDLINLLITLKGLSSKERLAQFNKKRIDLFLDYSMRSLLHAQKTHDFHIEAHPEIGRAEASKGHRESLKKYLTSHSWGDGSDAFRLLADALFPKDLVSASFNHDPTLSDADIIMVGFNMGMTSIPAGGATEFEEILKNDRRTLVEVERDYGKDPHLWHDTLFMKKLQKEWGINSLAELHKFTAFKVLPMAQSDCHYALIVHKSAAAAFGYEL